MKANTGTELLRAVLTECEQHAKRLQYAGQQVLAFLPFSETAVQQLDEATIGHIDQYIYRFAKLQDAMGNKLFRNLLSALGEDFSNRPLIDIFHRLEQLDIIQDFNTWQRLRVLRNEIAHDYDLSPAEQAEQLNTLFAAQPSLVQYLNQVRDYCRQRQLIS